MASSNPEVLFKTETVLKKDWYKRLKEIMVDGGWEIIPSHISDFDVLYSAGESGTTPMTLNMREFYTSVPANTISETAERILEVRMPGKYTPGLNGAKGTFERNDSWLPTAMIYSGAPANYYIKIHYHCNKNRLVLITECPRDGRDVNYAAIHFLGLSDRQMGEIANSGPVVFCSMAYAATVTIRAANHPAFTTTTSRNISIYTDLPEISTNIAGKRFLSELAYGAADTGIRGFIDGIYPISDVNLNVINGDILVDQDGIRYRVLEVNTPMSLNIYSSLRGITTFVAYRQAV